MKRLRDNRTSFGQVTLATYNAANRLVRETTLSGRTTYTYDGSGNLQSQETPAGDVVTNTWDYDHRNTQVELPTGSVVTYAYNTADLRVLRTDDVEAQRFVWDQKNLLLETDELGFTEADHTYEPVQHGNLVSRHAAAESSFYHYDALGSTSALTDFSEIITDEYTYDAWGNIRAESGGTTNPYRFVGRTGYYFDDTTGRYNLRRRDYDPHTARFLSEDPMDVRGEDSNLYRYVRNNSTNLTDPSGEQTSACSWLDWFLGTNDFCGTISSLGSVVNLIINNFPRGTYAALQRFFHGGVLGFNRFLNSFTKHAKGAIASWLGIDANVFNFDFGNVSFSNYLGLIVDLLGLSWNSLLDTAREAVGDELMSVLISVVGEIADIAETGIGKWIQDKVREVSDAVSDLASSVTDIARSMLRSGVATVLDSGVRAGIRWLIGMLNPAAAIVRVMMAIYDLVRWIQQNAARLQQMLQMIISAVQGAFAGDVAARIADKVETSLASFLGTLVTVLASIAGVSDVPVRVKSAIARLKNLLASPVKKVLTALGRKLAIAWRTLLRSLGLSHTEKSVVQATKWGDGNHNDLWSPPSGQIMVKYNPTTTVRDYINAQPQNTPTRQCLDRNAVPILKDLESKTRNLATVTTSSSSKAETKTIVPQADEVARLQAKLGEELTKCGSGGTDPCSEKGLTPGQAVWKRTRTVTVEDRRKPTNQTPVTCLTCGPVIQAIVVEDALALFDRTHLTVGSGSATDIHARKWARCVVGRDADDAGHVIANRLGGSGHLVDENIFAQTVHENRGIYRDREGFVAKAAANARVCIQITLHYNDGSTEPGRPESETYNVYVNYIKNPAAPINFSVNQTIPN